MRPRRMVAVAILLGACAGMEVRADPTPSCSYREERAEPRDPGTVAPRPLSNLALGQRHACVLEDGRDAWCWGTNDLHQLSRRTDPEPGTAWMYDDWWGRAGIVAGGAHTCAFNEHEVSCWGNDDAGQLGAPEGEPAAGVVEVETGIDEPTAMAAGLLHTCVTDSARVHCWGDGRAGQLGRPTEGGTQEPPAPVEGLPDGVVMALTAGALHTCALIHTEGRLEVWCWGDDRFGALGDGEPGESRHEPARVELDAVWQWPEAGAHHTCALVEEGDVYCWGRGGSGEFGDGRGEDSAMPVRVELPWPAVALTAGGHVELALEDGELRVGDGGGHTCAISEQGHARCWGHGPHGQLGTGSTESAFRPAELEGAHRWRELATGGDFTCGLTLDDDLLCWGANDHAQLGHVDPGTPTPAPATPW